MNRLRLLCFSVLSALSVGTPAGLSSASAAERLGNATFTGSVDLSGVTNKSTVRSDLGANDAGNLTTGTLNNARLSAQVLLSSGSYSDPSWLAIDFTSLASHPTTLSGYGITDAQALDADLTAIAALTTTSYGRSLLTQANAAAAQSTLGLVIGTNVLAPTGNGSGLTSLTAGNLSGQIPSANVSNAMANTGLAAMLPRTTAALARIASGSGRGRILMIGDSTTVGYGAAGSGYTGARAKNSSAALAKWLTARGVPARNSSFMGANQTLVSAATYDPRMAFSGGFAVSSISAIGKFGFQCTTSGGTLAFTPSESFDSAQVYYFQSILNGDINVNVDGGSTLVTALHGSSDVFNSVTANPTLGTHTLNLVASSSSFVFPIGVVCWDSTTPAFDIIQAGWDAGQSSDVASTANNIGNTDVPYSPLRASVSLAADLAIVNIGINDAGHSVSASTFQANLTTLLTALTTVSDVILVVPASCNGSPYPANQPAIRTAIYAVGASFNVPVVDLSTRFISYSSANALGLMYDSLHESQTGYQAIAAAIAYLLVQ